MFLMEMKIVTFEAFFLDDKGHGNPSISRASSESMFTLSPTSINRVFFNHTQTDNVIK